MRLTTTTSLALAVSALFLFAGCGALDAAGVTSTAANSNGDAITLAVDGVVRHDGACNETSDTFRGHGTWDIADADRYAFEVQVSPLRPTTWTELRWHLIVPSGEAFVEVGIDALPIPERLLELDTQARVSALILTQADIERALERAASDGLVSADETTLASWSGRDLEVGLVAVDAAQVASNTFAFPVRVCTSCLSAGMEQGACAYDGHAPHNRTTCIAGQDDVFRFCAPGEE